MRYLRSCAAFAGLVLLTSVVQAEPVLPNRVPAILMEALEKGDSFELYSLGPTKDESKEGFHGWKVLGKTAVKEDQTRKKLVEALNKGALENQGINPTKEFPPRLGIRVVYEGKPYDFALNFDSFKTEWFIDGNKTKGAFRVTKSPQAEFEKVLKEAKVALAEPPKTDEKKEPVRLPDAPLPGFPEITYNGTVLEVPGRDDKPLLKIVKAEYDKDKKMIVWLVELQNDIDYESWINIHHAWQNDEGDLSHGPAAFFFDKDRVQLYAREMKEQGQLRNGKKGDRIRLILDASEGFPEATFMEIRRPLPASAGYGR